MKDSAVDRVTRVTSAKNALLMRLPAWIGMCLCSAAFGAVWVAVLVLRFGMGGAWGFVPIWFCSWSIAMVLYKAKGYALLRPPPAELDPARRRER